MKKLIALMLITLMLLCACSKSQMQKTQPNNVPDELIKLNDNTLLLMAKLSLVSSVNDALNEKKHISSDLETKEKDIMEITKKNIPPKDQKNMDDDKRLKNIKLNQYTLDNVMYNSLKAENINLILKLADEDLPLGVPDYWSQIKSDLKELHTSWSETQVIVKKKDSANKYVEHFSTSLNSLSEHINNQNQIEALFSINSMTNDVNNFFKQYKNSRNNNLIDINYLIRQSCIYSIKSDFKNASTFAQKPIDILNKEKLKASNDLNKAKISLLDFKKAVDSQSLNLINLKGPIAIKNVNNICHQK